MKNSISEKPKRIRVQLHFQKPSMTEQSHKRECDINHIVNRFLKTGQMPSHIYSEPQYGNAPTIDLKTAMDLIKNMRTEFTDLSDEEKALFDNKSDNYAQFLSDYSESPESFIEPEAAEPDTIVSKTSPDSKEDSTDTNTQD